MFLIILFFLNNGVSQARIFDKFSLLDTYTLDDDIIKTKDFLDNNEVIPDQLRKIKIISGYVENVRNWSDSVAAYIPISLLEKRRDTYHLKPYPSSYLCDGEPYQDQNKASSCTGFLVDRDILFTAG